MAARHSILGGKVQLYKRPDARCWMCSTSIGGVRYRASTQREELAQAEDAAEDWYLELRGKFKRGDASELVPVRREKTFAEAAEQFLHEFPILTQGQRNRTYVENHGRRVRRHLLPFMGTTPITEVTSALVQEYRIHRIETTRVRNEARAREIAERKREEVKPAKPLARQTLHQEIVVIRQVLKTAQRHGWISTIPDLSQPYRTNTKISHRAWFSPEEYRDLYTETQRLAHNPDCKRYQNEYAQLHDHILFMANSRRTKQRDNP